MRHSHGGTEWASVASSACFTYDAYHANVTHQHPTPAPESGAIRPVVDKVFPFESTNEALAYVESGRAKGKVVIKVR